MAAIDITYLARSFRYCAFIACVSVLLPFQTSLCRKNKENARDDNPNKRITVNKAGNKAGARNNKNVNNDGHDRNSGNVNNNNNDNNDDHTDDDDNDDDDDDSVFASCVCYY